MRSIIFIVFLSSCATPDSKGPSNSATEKNAAKEIRSTPSALEISGEQAPIQAKSDCDPNDGEREHDSSDVEVGLAFSLPERSGDMHLKQKNTNFYSMYRCPPKQK